MDKVAITAGDSTVSRAMKAMSSKQELQHSNTLGSTSARTFVKLF